VRFYRLQDARIARAQCSRVVHFDVRQQRNSSTDSKSVEVYDVVFTTNAGARASVAKNSRGAKEWGGVRARTNAPVVTCHAANGLPRLVGEVERAVKSHAKEPSALQF